jgi:hypothetical protein
MQTRRSPLLIPAERGRVFRIVVGTLFVVLGFYVAVITVQRIQSGVLIWPSNYEPHLSVHRTTQPTSFWVAAIAWIVMCGWIIYAAIAEILYARRMPK